MRKKSSNLTLSKEAKKMAKELKKLLNRPSVTNVVEALIVEKHRQVFNPQPEAQAA